MSHALSFFAGFSLALCWAGHSLKAKRTPLFLIMFACCLLGVIVLRSLQ